jgi:hypothetical protein
MSSSNRRNSEDGAVNLTPSIMTVYFGTRAEGEIEDHGPGDVRAWAGIADERVALGKFPDRKAAMRAVSQAAEAAESAG